jgi:hypothetical protein
MQGGADIDVAMLALAQQRRELAAYLILAFGELANFIITLPLQRLLKLTAGQALGALLQFMQWVHHPAVEQAPDNRKGNDHLRQQCARQLK